MPQVEGWLGRGRTKFAIAGVLAAQKVQSGNTLNHFGSARGEFGNSLIAGERSGVGFATTTRRPPTSSASSSARSRAASKPISWAVSPQPGPCAAARPCHLRRLRYDADETYQGSSLQQNLNRNITLLRRRRPVGAHPAVIGWPPVGHLYTDRFLYAPVRDGNGLRPLVGVQFSPQALISGYARGRLAQIQDGGFRAPTTAVPPTCSGCRYARAVLPRRLRPTAPSASASTRDRASTCPTASTSTGRALGTRWEIFGRGSTRRHGAARTVSPSRALPRRSSWTRAVWSYASASSRGSGPTSSATSLAARAASRGARDPLPRFGGTTRLQRLDWPLPGHF